MKDQALLLLDLISEEIDNANLQDSVSTSSLDKLKDILSNVPDTSEMDTVISTITSSVTSSIKADLATTTSAIRTLSSTYVSQSELYQRFDDLTSQIQVLQTRLYNLENKIHYDLDNLERRLQDEIHRQ